MAPGGHAASGHSEARRRTDFYWDTVIFKVGDALFKVPRRGFQETSEVFAGMFLLPGGGSDAEGEGQSDDNPIVLSGYKEDEFAVLLKVLYPTPSDLANGGVTLTKEEWISVLKLSTVWEMDTVRQVALKSLTTQCNLSPIEKVALGRSMEVRAWLSEGLTDLVVANPGQEPEDLAKALDISTAFKILSMRMKTSPLTLIVPKSDGNVYCALECITCSRCFDALLDAPRVCTGCQVEIPLDGAEHVWFNSRSSDLKCSGVITNVDSKVRIESQLSQLIHLSCQKQPFYRGVTCAKCCATYAYYDNVFISASKTMATKVVHEAFKEDLDSCRSGEGPVSRLDAARDD